MPSGAVILTDELVNFAHNDAELSGVLAHELGHVAHRHAMRLLLADSSTALLFVTLFDATTGFALASTLPNVLTHAAYSREVEREADAYAFASMRAQNIDPAQLGALLERLGKADGQEQPGLLVSHPGFQERVSAAHGGAGH